MKYYVEKYYPATIALLSIALLICFRESIINISKLVDQICDNALSISVTLLGFFLTILTIINSIESRRMRFIKDLGLFPKLLEFLKAAIQANIFLIFISFLVKYIDHRQEEAPKVSNLNLFDLLYVYLFIYTILVSFRFTRIFVSLLTDPKNQ